MRYFCILLVIVGALACPSRASSEESPRPATQSNEDENRIRSEAATKVRLEFRRQLDQGKFNDARESAWTLEALSTPLLASGDLTAEIDTSLRQDIDRVAVLSKEQQDDCEQAWNLRAQASELTQRGEYSRSVDLLVKSRERFEGNLGRDSVFTVETRNDLCYALIMAGHGEAAASAAQQNVAIVERRFGRDHLQSILAYDCYATALASKDLKKAKQIQLDNLAITARRGGLRSTWRTTIACNLAEIYLRESDFVRARELLDGAEPMFRPAAPYYPIRNEFLYEFSVLLLGERQSAAASERFEESKRLPGRVYPPDSIVTADKWEHAARIAKRRGLESDAKLAAARAEKIRETLAKERTKIDEILKLHGSGSM